MPKLPNPDLAAEAVTLLTEMVDLAARRALGLGLDRETCAAILIDAGNAILSPADVPDSPVYAPIKNGYLNEL